MRTWIVLGFCLLIVGAGCAQDQITTFILVRHAEKVSDGSKDPELSPQGLARAASLSRMLSQTKIDAILSTPYIRTQKTVTPLSHAAGLTIQTYDASKFDYLDEALKNYAGGTVVICGHSNTIPGAANYLMGKNDLKNFEDHEYENILIVTVTAKGSGKLVKLNY